MNGWRGTFCELVYALLLWLDYMADNIITLRIKKDITNGAGGEHGQHTENKCDSAVLVASLAPTRKGD